MRIVGLHKLPFNLAAFEKDVTLPNHSPEMQRELKKQYRENWDNAWLVVIEYDGPATEIDFNAFAMGIGDNAQTPWMEVILDESAGKTVAGFYLHYVKPHELLFYQGRPLALPHPSPACPELFSRMPYSSPD